MWIPLALDDLFRARKPAAANVISSRGDDLHVGITAGGVYETHSDQVRPKSPPGYVPRWTHLPSIAVRQRGGLAAGNPTES